MIRRLEIAQNLLNRPKVLFLDEPTIGLDPATRDTVWDHVRDLREAFHSTIIITLHHMEVIEGLCDHIALINRGCIVVAGTLAELRAHVGPGATLDNVFIRLVGAKMDAEAEEGYGAVRRTRLATSEHTLTISPAERSIMQSSAWW
jgi:ABC-2 type transport system ATP-binding protein